MELRNVTESDMMLLFSWANDHEVRKNSFNTKDITIEEHEKWFHNMLDREDVRQFILMDCEKEVGQIRIRIEDRVAEIGYSIAPEFRGKGYGKKIILLLVHQVWLSLPEVTRIIGQVKPDNIASARAFLDNGFQETERTADKIVYELCLEPIDSEPCKVDDVGMSDSSVRIYENKVLKIQQDTEESENECRIMRWLEGKLPVPTVLANDIREGKNYLLMSKVTGEMSCTEQYMKNPQQLCHMLAEGLKLLWSVDITDCPCSNRLQQKLSMASETVKKGLVDMENTEPDTFGENGFRNPEALLEWLYQNQPEEEPVLSHGDYCLPNVFIQDDRISGYIDLGKCGVADKWCDIALCYRSLSQNFSGKYDGKTYPGFRDTLLFEELGMEPDWNKIKYYILLDELF